MSSFQTFMLGEANVLNEEQTVVAAKSTLPDLHELGLCKYEYGSKHAHSMYDSRIRGRFNPMTLKHGTTGGLGYTY